MKKLLLISSFFLLFVSATSVLFAGTTGKISGKVTDAETGEALPGINIIVEGTTLGAATDLDGEYVINNIPPGAYNVIVSGVGFTKQIHTNVQVAIDFTTKLNLEMSTETIAMDAVVVEAKAPLVRKDLTSSRTSVDATEIEALPVESVGQLLSLQAGITTGAGGELHIRGGRSTEIQYTVNGVSISNPFNNAQMVSIATNAIQELSVVSGTFNAEYGNALSGIVNTITKEGGSDYRGSLRFYTGDYVSDRSGIFHNIEEVSPASNMTVEGTLGGPILGSDFTFFISGRYNKDNGYLYGIRQHLPTDSVYRNPFDPNDIRVAANGDGESVAMNPYEGFSGTAKLTVKPFNAVKINYDLIYSQSKANYYSHLYKYNPDATLDNRSFGLSNSLTLSHAVSNSTFYTVKASYNINDYKQYQYPLLNADGSEADFSAGDDLTGLHADPRYQPDYKSNRVTSYTFYSGGTQNSHYYQKAQTVGGKFDITSQITNQHEVKFGVEGKYHDMAYESFSVQRDSTRYLTATIPSITTPNRDSYVKNPWEFSAYVQDKMEFESLILNIGVRFDLFDAQSQYSTDTFNPSPNNPNLPSGVDPDALLADADPKWQLSPRVGVSFPITDRGIIHFSYGHFIQMPPFRNLYVNPDFKYSLAVGEQLFGNANLEPERTISYELGLQQQLSENVAFNTTAYYKDVRDLLALQRIRIDSDEVYLKYVNKDYANIKGLTFSLTKRRTANDWLGARLDYTFQVAEGNDVNANSFFIDLNSGRQSEKIPVYLSWDQSHNLTAQVMVGETGNWLVSLIAQISTGLPYTPRATGKEVFLEVNSDRKPSKFNLDLMAEKDFSFGDINFTVFFKIFNLFDTLNENLVYSSTGRATYTLDEDLAAAEKTNELSQEIPNVISAEEYFDNPTYYDPPREVRFGVSLDF